ncbi:hypothetical protein J4401_03905 [Candidatus Woesearchaeota archaeon]|nr:hypothetical protein [Candidatus Woesearchaeota archaeon]
MNVEMGKNHCAQIERWIVKYANSARKKRGITTFRTNWGLIKIARIHSGKMARERKIWHGDGVHRAGNSLTSKSFWDFIKLIFYRGYSGENVGLIYKGRVKGFKHLIITTKDIAFAQHKSWMKSQGHRENMLNSNFSLIGVGVVQNKNDFYCTQLFYG